MRLDRDERSLPFRAGDDVVNILQAATVACEDQILTVGGAVAVRVGGMVIAGRAIVIVKIIHQEAGRVVGVVSGTPVCVETVLVRKGSYLLLVV